jgi:branched-chain amino acid transport system permease protein
MKPTTLYFSFSKILILVAFLFLLSLPFYTGSYILHVVIMILFFGYLGACWNILAGYAGQISLGHAIFLGAGAYTSTVLFLKAGVSPWIGMWAGGISGMLLGLFIGYLTFRYGLKGHYFILATLAFGAITKVIALNVEKIGAAQGLIIPFKASFANFQFVGKTFYYYYILFMVVGIVLICTAIERSRFGQILMAIREDEDAAESLGVNIFRYKLFAMIISSFLTALAGTFYAFYIGYIHPDTLFTPFLSIQITLIPITGGMGSVFGPIVGSFILSPVSEITRGFLGKFSGLHLMVWGLIIMLIVILIPRGIIVELQHYFRKPRPKPLERSLT